MSIWSRLTGRGTKAGVWSDGGAFQDMLGAILSGVTAKSGATVNRQTAFRVAVVFCCLRVLGEGVAQVPFKVMRSGRS